MTLEQAKKECKAIWKWLSENSDPDLDASTNKIDASYALKINITSYCFFCPYCEYEKNYKSTCRNCPIFIKYNKNCCYLGYKEWERNCTKENAKKFYEIIEKT